MLVNLILDNQATDIFIPSQLPVVEDSFWLLALLLMNIYAASMWQISRGTMRLAFGFMFLAAFIGMAAKILLLSYWLSYGGWQFPIQAFYLELAMLVLWLIALIGLITHFMRIFRQSISREAS